MTRRGIKTKKIFLMVLLVLLIACQPKTVYVKVEEKALNETMYLLKHCVETGTAFTDFFNCNTEMIEIEIEYATNENAFYACLKEYTPEFCIQQLITLQTPVRKRLSAKNAECSEHVKNLSELNAKMLSYMGNDEYYEKILR